MGTLILEPPKSMAYLHYYFAFCDVFGLSQIRKKITSLDGGIVIEIRCKEKGHNLPHIHARYQGENIAISLVDGKVLAGNIPSKRQKIASEWVMNNIDELREEWNAINADLFFPDWCTKI